MKIWEETTTQWGLKLSDHQKRQLEIYYELLREWNQKMNLTAIVDKENVYLKHFLDSLSLTQLVVFQDQSLLDVGSGAGFPGLPLKIVFPNLRLSLVEATQKRTYFMQEVVNACGLENVEVVHSRIEDFKAIDHYDIVTARAVAPLPILLEWCLPYVKVGGSFIAMKGPNLQEERKLSEHILNLLGAELKETKHFKLGDYERTLLLYQKAKLNPQGYPRPYGKLKKLYRG